MAQQILLRRGTALQWTTANPILAQGEQGLETDTNLIKIGDGSTTWTLLSYTSAIGLLKANNLSDLANVVTARTNLGLGTLATQNGTFSGTSSGTNTGDNAVNSLYSGLVTNATHTGDATGSTALTVVAINGTSLSGLATGLLKNTTSTGVPSIAVAGTDYIAGGVGTANYFPIFSGSGVLINSLLNQYNGNLGFGTATPTHDLTVEYSSGGASADWGDFPSIKVSNTNTSGYSFSAVRLDANNGTVAGGFFVDGLGNSSGIGGSDAGLLFQSRTNHLIAFGTNDTERMRITNDGKVIVNSFTNSGYQFDVNGTGRFTGALTIGSTTASTSTTTGALIISGGLGVGGALYGTTGNFSSTLVANNLSGTNTGDQTITLTGAVTGSGTGSFATTLASSIVGISNLSATGTPDGTKFLRGDNTWAVPAGGGGLSDGDKGDITVSSSGTVWTLDTVTANKGGTGLTSYAVGDLIYASASTTLSKLVAVATGNVLISGGITTAPSWGKVGLTTHVSGTLPVAYGGTGITSAGGIGSLLVGSGTTSFNTVAGNTTTTKKYLTQTGDGVDSDDPVWESLETVGISWITYSDTITWNSTAPSGATTHEYRYYQIGKMVFGFIRLEYANAGVTNTTLTLATNSFPVISKPSNAANGENMIACTGYIDSSNTGSPPATRCWLEASANTSGFVVKFTAASQSAKFAMCSFTYLTA